MSASALSRASERRRSPLVLREWSRADAATILTLTLVALGVRIPLVGQTLAGDEVHTYGVVHGRSLGEMLHELRSGGEVSPPIYFLLAWAGAKTSDPTLWMRMPSLLFGTAAVPLTYLLGCRTVGRLAAALGAALLALSPCGLYYAVEARPYSMLLFLVVLSSLLLLHAAGSQRRSAWALYALSAVAILYTHYFGFFPVAAQCGWALWTCRARWRMVIVTYGLIALALVPLLPTALDQRPNHADILSYVTLTPDWVLRQSAKVLPGHPNFSGKEIPGAALQAAFGVVLGIAALVAVWGVVRRRRRGEPRDSARSLPWVLAATTGVGLILLSLAGDNTFQVKYLVGTLPAFVLVIGALVSAMPRPLAMAGGIVVLGVIVVGCVKSFESRYARPPFRQAANFIADRATADDAVIDASGFSIGPRLRRYSRPLEIYLDRSRFRLVRSQKADSVFAHPPGGQIFVVGPKNGFLKIPEPESKDGLCQVDGRVFAGSTPIVVHAYQSVTGPRTTRLLGAAGGRAILLPSGSHLPVRPGAALGFVDRVAVGRRKITVTGWALDGARRPVGCVVVFDRDGRFLGFGTPELPRADVARDYGASAERAGFKLRAPTPDSRPTDPHPEIRAFAVANGVASELHAPDRG